jgi:Family of unknown function (DUF5681)
MRRNGGAKKGTKPYAVGYGKPPIHTRFKKGVSGNPAGKKKGQKGLKAVVEGVFQEKVSIRTARGIRKVTKLDALVHKLMNDALTGDSRAAVQVVRLAKEAGLTQEAEAIEAATQELTEEDRMILDRYMKAPG